MEPAAVGEAMRRGIALLAAAEAKAAKAAVEPAAAGEAMRPAMAAERSDDDAVEPGPKVGTSSSSAPLDPTRPFAPGEKKKGKRPTSK